ncbi:MAG: hypothetical protein WA609_18835 [Terriglobales bacterium]
MPSTRSKLVLDEDSFQGLLAAAFTIQQYNDKQGGIDALLSTELAGAMKTAGAAQKSGAPTNGTVANGAGANRAGTSGNGTNGVREKIAPTDAGTLPAAAVDLCRQCGAPLLAAGLPCSACDGEVFRPGERLQRTWATMWSLSQEQGTFPGSLERTGAESPLGAADLAGVAAEDRVVAPGADEATLAFSNAIDINGVTAASGSAGPRVKVRFRRADLYLGLSVLVALVALLWPTASAGRAELTPWERVLVAVGIAEAPASEAEVQYSGDPNIKVWVDTQAALYYCPGDELYGKSPGGHYTTQHDAQLDRFEPAFRRACVP